MNEKLGAIHKPPNEKIIDEVWIGMSEDADGKNGIVATLIPGFGGSPMVTSSKPILEYFKGQARAGAQMAGARVKIYRFTRAECVYDTEDRNG